MLRRSLWAGNSIYVYTYTHFSATAFAHAGMVVEPCCILTFACARVAMASTSEIQEFQKHCYASLELTKRKLDYSTYGGKTQALEAAKQFLKQSKWLLFEFSSLNRAPTQRKEFILQHFGADAILNGKTIAAQKAKLISRLVSGDVSSVEATMMEAAVRAAPGLAKPSALSLKYDQESQQFKAVLGEGGESMTKLFTDIAEGRHWLLSMGKSAEARYMHIQIQIHIHM